MITQSDNLVYFDTENTKIEPFDKGGVTGLLLPERWYELYLL